MYENDFSKNEIVKILNSVNLGTWKTISLRDECILCGRLLKDTGNLKIPGAIFDYRSKWLPNIMKRSSRHVYAVFKMADCMPRRKILTLLLDQKVPNSSECCERNPDSQTKVCSEFKIINNIPQYSLKLSPESVSHSNISDKISTVQECNLFYSSLNYKK